MINLKNKWWIILVIIIIIGCIGVYFFINKNKNNTNDNNSDGNNYNSSKTSANQENNISNNKNNTENQSNKNNSEQNSMNETNKIEITENSTGNSIENSNGNPNTNEQEPEEVISTFSTKIYTKESSRQNNVSITCSSLNGTIVPNGSTFSFCDTLGPATPNQGYQKADTFDQHGNKVKEYGGGKCQVSTTLYNAVLSTSGLVVTERHPHSNKVPYIQTGKDAAVSYGSYDLKFRNDTGFDIKIKAENTADNITISLVKI